jgi:hypothetical protein
MGTRLFKVSDISGKVVENEGQLTQLTIESHPTYEEQITLEVLPEEVEGKLPETRDFVAISYQAPGDLEPSRFLMSLADFNNLFQGADTDAILQRALSEQQEAQEAGRGRTRTQRSQTRTRINWASPEHAGEPHRGTISEAERIYVQEHLDEVNARLREQGMREIDPTDLTMIERYGFTPPEL